MELKGVENLEIRRSVYFYYILDDSKLSWRPRKTCSDTGKFNLYFIIIKEKIFKLLILFDYVFRFMHKLILFLCSRKRR